jgi:hypothetical protein
MGTCACVRVCVCHVVQGIHINGELNVVVDNTVLMLDGVTPV